MRPKQILLFVPLFVLALVLTFPYESLVRYGLSRSVPNLRYATLRAAPWGIRMTDVQAQISSGRSVVFDRVGLWPAGLFPPALKAEWVRGAGRVDIHVRGSKKEMNFDVSVSNVRIQEMIAPPIGLDMTVDASARGALKINDGVMAITEMRFKSDQSSFDGSGTISPVFPFRAARMQLKGQAVLAGQPMPIERTFSIGEMFPAH